MPKLITTIAGLFFTISTIAQTTRLEIKSLPPFHTTENFYAAGSFNSWNPQDQQYQFKKDDKGNYFLDVKLSGGKYEYKITRGSWDKVECKTSGENISNRTLAIPSETPIQIIIEEWQDLLPKKPKLSTASKNVHIIETAFHIPQLNRNRRIWVYLPNNYTTSKTKYPVLYMHDGQNVFEDTTSFSGEWGVDDFLDSTRTRNCIVVAIDNGGDKRMNEYNPYDNTRFGKGEGDAYVDFIVKTLKPFIDKKYRTAKSKENTFITGSSMGGLISMYAILKYPKVFGGAGVFSPSFWIAPQIYDAIKAKGNKVKGSVFFFVGKKEGENMVPDMLKAFEEMAKVSKAKMKTVIKDDGKHNESTWRKEFPSFYKWLITSK
jgi:predicted alpha/beta superfamily hydrolase